MANKADGEGRHRCTYLWKVENISLCWWQKKGDKIASPRFVADALEGTKWSLWLYPMGDTDQNSVALYIFREKDCSGPSSIEINFQFELLGKDDSVLKAYLPLNHSFTKETTWGTRVFETRERVFFTEKKTFLFEDTLTIRCNMWMKDKESLKCNYLFAANYFNAKRSSILWRIKKVSSLKSGMKNKLNDSFINFDLTLNENLDKIKIDISSYNDILKYIAFKILIIDSTGKKEICGNHEYLPADLKIGALSSTLSLPDTLMKNKSRYLPDDVLTLEFVYSTVEFDRRKISSELENDVLQIKNESSTKPKSKNISNLINDLKAIYENGILSDTRIRTATENFPAHKVILSARSPVFRNMFSNDMKENNSGCVDLIDFEDGTIHQMLLYMYTDSTEDLQLESASELYKISDKYQILSLKSRCSIFLKENLCPANACDVLILADLHSDDELLSAVQDYMLKQGKIFFNSQEWKDFMKNHVVLASDIMYKKMCLE